MMESHGEGGEFGVDALDLNPGVVLAPEDDVLDSGSVASTTRRFVDHADADPLVGRPTHHADSGEDSDVHVPLAPSRRGASTDPRPSRRPRRRSRAEDLGDEDENHTAPSHPLDDADVEDLGDDGRRVRQRLDPLEDDDFGDVSSLRGGDLIYMQGMVNSTEFSWIPLPPRTPNRVLSTEEREMVLRCYENLWQKRRSTRGVLTETSRLLSVPRATVKRIVDEYCSSHSIQVGSRGNRSVHPTAFDQSPKLSDAIRSLLMRTTGLTARAVLDLAIKEGLVPESTSYSTFYKYLRRHHAYAFSRS